MAKLVLSLEGAVLQQCFIEKERLTIGRDAHNKVVIDDPIVSREHAAITTVGNDQILEDLQSSNGTVVNGGRITRHILHHGDVIEFGNYHLRYLNPKLSGDINLERTMLIESLPRDLKAPPQSAGLTPTEVAATAARTVKVRFPKGSIKALFGPRAPSTVELNRVITTFGKQGESFAVITRRPMGYFITHVDGAKQALVNKQPIGKSPHPLNPNDVIEVAGDTFEFQLDAQ